MRTDPYTVSKRIGIILIVLSLVTTFAGLAEFGGRVTQVSPDAEMERAGDPPESQMDELSSEDQEIVRKAIQCDGDLTVYGSSWSTLSAPFDEKYHPNHETEYGRLVTYQGDTHHLYVSLPWLFGEMIPRALVIIKALAFLGIGYLFYSYANTAEDRRRRRQARVLSILGGFLILALLWIGNYHYYILTPVSCG